MDFSYFSVFMIFVSAAVFFVAELSFYFIYFFIYMLLHNRTLTEIIHSYCCYSFDTNISYYLHFDLINT